MEKFFNGRKHDSSYQCRDRSYRDGQKYRCVVTSESGYSATSDAAAIIIGVAEDAPHITSQR